MISKYPTADKRRVFLASRSVFSGQNVHIRKAKKIRETVLQYNSLFKPLVNDFGINKTTDIIKILLEQKIFESELKAKIEFPELYQISPARSLQHAALENDAAQSEAEALGGLEPTDGVDDSNRPAQMTHSTEPPKTSETNVPSLYPPNLPFTVQYFILTTVQRQLEEICFDFATRWLPGLLRDKKWDCSQAVELTVWTKILPGLCNKLPTHAIHNNSGSSLDQVFSATDVLRHSAVHRLPTSSKGIMGMIHSALTLAMTLGDVSKATQLGLLEAELARRIKDMELNKNFLESRLDEQLQTICEQRAELDKKESSTIAATLHEDKQNEILIGSLLEYYLRDMLALDWSNSRQNGGKYTSEGSAIGQRKDSMEIEATHETFLEWEGEDSDDDFESVDSHPCLGVCLNPNCCS